MANKNKSKNFKRFRSKLNNTGNSGDGTGPTRVPLTIGAAAAAYRLAHPAEAWDKCFTVAMGPALSCFTCNAPLTTYEYFGLRVDDTLPCATVFCLCSKRCQTFLLREYLSAGHKVRRLNSFQLRRHFDQDREEERVGLVEGPAIDGQRRNTQDESD